MTPDTFPALQQFLGGYFHQDFLLDYASSDEAIVAFRTDEPKELVHAVCNELKDFLTMIQAKRADVHDLLQQFGCYYDPSFDGLTVAGWFAHIEGELSR